MEHGQRKRRELNEMTLARPRGIAGGSEGSFQAPPYSGSFDQGGHREKAVGTLTLPKPPVGVDTRGTGRGHQTLESDRPGPKSGLRHLILLDLDRRLKI